MKNCNLTWKPLSLPNYTNVTSHKREPLESTKQLSFLPP